jgi:hypothetical protein
LESRPVWNPRGNATEIPDKAAAQLKALLDAKSALTIEELLELDPHLEVKDLASYEGRILIKNHLLRERNQALVKKKKQAVLSTTGALACKFARWTSSRDTANSAVDLLNVITSLLSFF